MLKSQTFFSGEVYFFRRKKSPLDFEVKKNPLKNFFQKKFFFLFKDKQLLNISTSSTDFLAHYRQKYLVIYIIFHFGGWDLLEGVVLQGSGWCHLIDNLYAWCANLFWDRSAKGNMSKHVARCEPQKKSFFWIKIFFWRIKKNASYHHIEHSFPQLLRKKKKKISLRNVEIYPKTWEMLQLLQSRIVNSEWYCIW